MSITRDAYALAERVRERQPETAQRLRKAAVSVPAFVASALEAVGSDRDDSALRARGALAQVAREADSTDEPGRDALAESADELARSVLFQLGGGGAVS